ncbi:hypothetical protein GGF46_002039 [Coemansia sp. RSA 552]|nr:hypothetical protein GGF46_002039 [Coemansia sp. RSA 552]
MCALRVKVSQEYPSLVQLADVLEGTLGTIRQATQQLSKSGVTRDAMVLAQLPTTLPTLEMLELLESLQRELGDRPELPEDAEPLGLRDRQVVAQAIDLVLIFEVLPRLAPGIGMPLDRRVTSNASAVMGALRQLPGGKRNWEPSAKATLSDLVCRLLQIVGDGGRPGTVAALVVDKYHPDLIAALFQLAYAPLPPDHPAGTQLLIANEYQVEADPERRVELRRGFTRLFDSSNPYLILETLTALLNTALAHGRVPRWYPVLCSRFLARVLMKYPEDGVRIFLDFIVGNDDGLSAKKLDRITALLLTPPMGVQPDEYFGKVLPQIRRIALPVDKGADEERLLLGVAELDEPRERMVQAARHALCRAPEKDKCAFVKYVAGPICEPLRRWRDARAAKKAALSEPDRSGIQLTASSHAAPLIQEIDGPDDGPLAEDRVTGSMELAQTLDTLRQLVLDGIPPVALLVELVLPELAPLLSWFAHESGSGESATGKLHRTAADALRDILVTTLRVLPSAAALSALLGVVQSGRDGEADHPQFAVSGAFTQLVWPSGSSDERPADLPPVDAVMDILGSTKLKTLAGDLFLTLLREQQALLEMVEQATVENADLARKWWGVSQATMAMAERFGPRVLARHRDVLDFVLGVLDRHAPAAELAAGGQQEQTEVSIEALMESLSVGGAPAQEDGAVERAVGGTEMVLLALMLLGQMMAASEAQSLGDAAAADLPAIEWDAESAGILRRIQGSVRRLADRGMPVVAHLARQTQLQIGMALAINDKETQRQLSSAVASEGGGSDEARFAAALADVQSDLVPVRAHGIIELRNLVLARSSAVVESEERLSEAIGVFVEMAQMDDSFLYLNAIRGLSALADLHGRRFIPRLVAMYGEASSLDGQMRIGEALLQSILRAGLMLGDYAGLIVPPMLAVLRESDTHTQMQSILSIFAAIARTCPFALQQWVVGLSQTVDGLLLALAAVEDAAAVRRAAVVFWADLVEGLGPQLLAMDAGALRTVYRTLRRVAECDSDELARAHSQQGVEQIDAAVKGQVQFNYLA